MDYSRISDNDLQIINGSILRYYLTISKELYETDIKKVKKQQNQFLKNESVSIENLSDECQAYFSKDIEPFQFLKFLDGCQKEFDKRGEAKKQRFFVEFSDLSTGTIQEHVPVLPAVIEFILCFIVAGGLFSIGFNLIFFPFMWVIMWLLGERENIGKFLSQMPWLFSILFTWIGFGGIFGLVEMLSKRK